MNFSGFCISCADACTECRNVAPDLAKDIVALVEMPDPSTYGDFIDDVEPLLPQDIPKVDLVIVINVHPDILYASPKFKEAGVKAIIGDRNLRRRCLGAEKTVGEEAAELGWRRPCKRLRFAPIQISQHRSVPERRDWQSGDRVHRPGSRGERVIMGAMSCEAPPRIHWFWQEDAGPGDRLPDLGRGYPRLTFLSLHRVYGEGMHNWDTVLHVGGYHTRCSGGGAEEGNKLPRSMLHKPGSSIVI